MSKTELSEHRAASRSGRSSLCKLKVHIKENQNPLFNNTLVPCKI